MRVRETAQGHEIASENIEEILDLIVNDRIRNKIIWKETHVIPITPAKFYVALRGFDGTLKGVWRFHSEIRPFPLYKSKLGKAKDLEREFGAS